MTIFFSALLRSFMLVLSLAELEQLQAPGRDCEPGACLSDHPTVAVKKSQEWRIFLPIVENSPSPPDFFSAEYDADFPKFKITKEKTKRRLDEYLRLSAPKVGLKKRGGKKLELKVRENRTPEGIELWGKMKVESIEKLTADFEGSELWETVLKDRFEHSVWVRLEKSIKKRKLDNGLRFEQTDLTVEMDGSSGLEQSHSGTRTADGAAFIAGYTEKNHTIEWKVTWDQWRSYAIEGIGEDAEERVREFLTTNEIGRRMQELGHNTWLDGPQVVSGSNGPINGPIGYPAFVTMAVAVHQPRPSMLHLRPSEYAWLFLALSLCYSAAQHYYPDPESNGQPGDGDGGTKPWHETKRELSASTGALKGLASKHGKKRR